MPASYDAPERITWREDNADLVTWLALPANLSGGFLTSLAESLTRYGSLTPAQTAAARRIMDERQANLPDNLALAATAEQATNIHNGLYTIDDGTVHLTYKIHTVRNGRMAGKRIIKRQMAYGEFAGFAFLTAEGTLKVWRRFYADEAINERYIVWARLLLRCLTGSGLSGNESEWGYVEDSIEYGISAARTCRACNRTLTTPTSIERGIGPECEGRQGADRTSAANAHERISINALAGSDAYVADSDTAISVTPLDADGNAVGESAPLYARQSVTWDSVDTAATITAEATNPDDSLSRDDIVRLLPVLAQADRERFTRLLRQMDYYSRLAVCTDCGNVYNGRRGVAMHRRSCTVAAINRNRVRAEEAERRAARMAAQEAALLAAGPALSQLGTRIGGQVWEQ